jgi:hypothetical protein
LRVRAPCYPTPLDAVVLFVRQGRAGPGTASTVLQPPVLVLLQLDRPNGEFFKLFRTAPFTRLVLLSEGLCSRAEGASTTAGGHRCQSRSRAGFTAAQPIDATDASGTFVLWDSSGCGDAGGVQTRWQRAAGSHRGVCILNMQGQGLVPPRVPASLRDHRIRRRPELPTRHHQRFRPRKPEPGGRFHLPFAGPLPWPAAILAHPGHRLLPPLDQCPPPDRRGQRRQLEIDRRGTRDYFGPFFEDGDPSTPTRRTTSPLRRNRRPHDWDADGVRSDRPLPSTPLSVRSRERRRLEATVDGPGRPLTHRIRGGASGAGLERSVRSC